MKSILSIIPAILVALLCFSASGAEARLLTVLSPRDGSFVESSSISLVVRIESKDIDDIQVSVGSWKQAIPAKALNRIFACFEGVRLAPGMNTLHIAGFKEGKKAEEIDYRVYYRTDLSSDASTAPSGYPRYYFHTPDHEKECTACHRLDFSGTPDDPPSPEKSPCYVCHKKMMLNYRQVHGPAAVWSCPICHDLRSKGRKMETVQPDGKVCKGCHENAWQTKKFMHGPTAAGQCTACHNPHASDQPYFLRLKTADLCVACHEDTASRPHVISGFSGVQGHPILRSPDPFHPDRDFTCASCHNPHATDFQYLLSKDGSSMFQFCQSCHRM